MALQKLEGLDKTNLVGPPIKNSKYTGVLRCRLLRKLRIPWGTCRPMLYTLATSRPWLELYRKLKPFEILRT